MVIVTLGLLAACATPGPVPSTTTPPSPAVSAPTVPPKTTTAAPSPATSPTQPATSSTPAKNLPKLAKIAGYAPPHLFGVIPSAFINVLNKYTDVHWDLEPLGASSAAVPPIERGEVQFWLNSDLSTRTAFTGQEDWAKKPNTFLRQVMLGNTFFQGIHTTDPKIKTISDLKGKRVFFYYKGLTMVELVLNTAFAAYGMTVKDVQALSYSAMPETEKAMVEGKADAVMRTYGSWMEEIRRSVHLHTINIPADVINARFRKDFPELFPRVIPKGTWGSEEEITTLGYSGGLWAHKDVSDDLVYLVLDTLYNHYNEYASVNADLAQFKLDVALRSIGVPLHPGAIRYFKDKGLWTPDLEKAQQERLEWVKSLEAQAKK